MSFIGNSPLHIGAINKSFELLKILCNFDGIDFMAKNKENKTPIDLIRMDKKLRVRMVELFQND
jgi:hypothetical protein